MTTLVRMAAALIIGLSAASCFATEDKEAPQPGTIEVEVVYKDTGERVETCFRVEVLAGERSVLVLVPISPRLVEAEAAYGEYRVRVGTIGPSLVLRHLNQASAFITRGLDSCQAVVVSEDEPVARVRFEVERGWQFRGTVRRQDGSPLPQALVMVEQGASRAEWAYAFTGSDGTFSMLGVVPAERARVRIESLIEFAQYRPAGLALLSVGEIELAGEETEMDFEIETASLDLVVDYELPVWPPRSLKDRYGPAIAIWIDADPADGPEAAELLLDYVPLHVTLPRRTAFVFRSDRYNRLIRDLPKGKTVTLGIGIKDSAHDEPYNPTAGCTFFSTETATVEVPTRSVHVRVYAPGARTSRLYVMGAAALVVLAVCVPILVRQARRRRLSRG